MTLLDNLTQEMKTALKAGDKKRLGAVRLMISAIKYALVDEPEMAEEGVIQILLKEAKKRRESIEAFQAAGRQVQAEQEQYELAVIEEYLPRTMGEAEVRAKVLELLSGQTFPNFGSAMGMVMKELKGKAEGGIIARVVKEEYQGND